MSNTTLHDAAKSGDASSIKKLIEEGTNIDSQDKYGRTALHRATSLNQIDSVKLLFKNGADINASNMKGETPFDVAIREGNQNLAIYLLDSGSSSNMNRIMKIKYCLEYPYLSELLISGEDIECFRISDDEIEKIDEYLNDENKSIELSDFNSIGEVHYFISLFNFDDGLSIIKDIVRTNRCKLPTAVLLWDLLDGSYYLDFDRNNEDISIYEKEPYELYKLLTENTR